ncbi:BgTH12-00116 [Blumeria graminis f. sp. triticale]|uniref:Bgt-4431 n=3 Tax=Blumeria graminis TaxID=34373 RepID=A0A381L6W3_BLUGR|nr:hypothetical protein BGT96224_4431 [Blumeria graminis f. sp. tritici 96224]CAD6504608.1 BgTH12-00116 [Blumeria graminis f. sp. triticale]VDB92638.1 Bgt-4431 [Blumeria graminis f. sp. tritici]
MTEVKDKTANPSFVKLSINPQPWKPINSARKKESTLDSWEDEQISSEDEIEDPLSPEQPANFPLAPPATPISQTISFTHESLNGICGYNLENASDVRTARGCPRPDKTDAAAKRMIAGALGIKPSKKTEDQMAYEKAVKEREVKRRKQEKEALQRTQIESERAQQAIWSD